MKRVKLGSYAMGVMALLFAGTAAAQLPPPEQQPQPQPQPQPAPQPQPQAQPVQAQGEVGMALPGAAPAQQAGAVAGESDHDTMIGRLAVGYLGRRSMLIAAEIDPAAPALAQEVIDAPVVGIRYWLDQMIGIDAGVGFLITAGSQETTVAGTTQTVDDAGITAFILHAGIPLSLGSEGHFSFQLVPEANVGFASRSQSIPNPPGSTDIDMSGFHFDVGLRAGAEIHFGFIDIPQLSLQGSIGVRYALDNTSVTGTTNLPPAAPVESTIDRSQSAFGTTVGDNPWNIFTSNVAALYYF